MKKFSILIFTFLLVGNLLAQVKIDMKADLPKAKYGTFALTNGTFETVSQGSVAGTMVISDGKITALGKDVTVPEGATVIDCKGLTVYPGMIDSGTRLGLAEIGSIGLTQDSDEAGEVTPQVQALTAVNPNSVLIPVTRVSGVTTVLTVPQRGLFPGTAALIDLHGYTPQQMFAGFKGVAMNFPSSTRRGYWDRRTDEEVKKDAEKAMEELEGVWEKVAEYAAIDSAYQAGAGNAPEYYPEMAALLPVFRGEAPVLIEVDASTDIEKAIEWVKEHEVQAIFTGVAEGWRVADQLAEAEIPVITGPVLSTPSRASDKYDRPYANAGMMHKAGVKVAIRTSDAENVRNLPYNAGFAATYGMGREAALRAVTLSPAEIFGLSDRMGSLEVGKAATLFVADGDPFETKTQVKHVFINGWLQPMDSRHIRLYEEFLEREPGVQNR